MLINYYNYKYTDKKRLLEYKKNKEMNDVDTLLKSTYNYDTYYNIMTFYSYRVCDSDHDITLIRFKILYVDKNKNIIIDNLRNLILDRLNKNKYTNYFFYKTHGVNPNLITYDILKYSNYSNLHIIVNKNKSKKLCLFYNNNKLYKLLYPSLYFLVEYDDYYKKIKCMDINNLVKEYYETYGENINICLRFKKIIIKYLLDNKKRQFITNY